MIKVSDFKPAWWLPSPHIQTIWPILVSHPFYCNISRERLELKDGDFLDLDWVGRRADSPIVVVLHGLGGSIKSPYAKGIMQAIEKKGWRGVLIHFRGCSGEHNRLARSYHSGDTGDLAYVVEQIKRREPNTPIAAIGYSLGGNVLLKWLGETGANNPLVCAAAVSVPFELHKAVTYIQKGSARIYQWWLLRDLRMHAINKFSRMTPPYEFGDIRKLDNFWLFDERVTAPLHGFRNAYDYYSHSSARRFLKFIRTPTLIIHAIDDPFMTSDTIPEINDLSGSIELELSETGGHVGFVTEGPSWKGDAWLEKRIPSYLEQYL
jgi:predicted alpha/beta-fold hydrolase